MADNQATHNLTAFFDDREDAEEAIHQLKVLGLSDAQMRLTGGEDVSRLRGEEDEKGFFSSIADFFFPDGDRRTYAEGLRRGGWLLTVSNVPHGHYDAALDILDEEGSVDLDERSEQWRADGWTDEPGDGLPRSGDRLAEAGAPVAAASAAAATGVDLAAGREAPFSDGLRADPPAKPATLMADDATAMGVSQTDASGRPAAAGTADTFESLQGDEEVISVVEERLRIGKRDVTLGRVRVRSYVVETPVSEDVTLRSDHVAIERRPVDRLLAEGEAAFTDRVIEAEEHAEEAVIAKEARVREEIALRRTSEERTETVTDTVRHTEVEVEDTREAALHKV